MARLIHLVLLTGLIGFSAPQIMACGDDSKDKKENKDDDKDEDDDNGDGKDEEDGDDRAPSGKPGTPEEVCAHVMATMEAEGGHTEYVKGKEIAEGEAEKCANGMEIGKAMMGDDLWNDFSSCALKTQSEADYRACEEAMDNALEKQMMEAMGGKGGKEALDEAVEKKFLEAVGGKAKR